MAHWIIGYAVGAYASMTEILLNVPGLIRRIVAGFYIVNNTTVSQALTPVVTANADNEIQIFTQKSVKIFHAANLQDLVLFLLVETELEYPSKQAIAP